MENNFDDFDQLFRERLGEEAEQPPGRVWEALERRLDKDKKRRVLPMWWYITLVSVFSMLGLALAGVQAMNSGLTAVSMQGAVQPDNGRVAADVAKVTNATAVAAVAEDQAATVIADEEMPVKKVKKRQIANNGGRAKDDNAGEELEIDAEKHDDNEGQEQRLGREERTSRNAPTVGTSAYSYDDFEEGNNVPPASEQEVVGKYTQNETEQNESAVNEIGVEKVHDKQTRITKKASNKKNGDVARKLQKEVYAEHEDRKPKGVAKINMAPAVAGDVKTKKTVTNSKKTVQDEATQQHGHTGANMAMMVGAHVAKKVDEKMKMPQEPVVVNEKQAAKKDAEQAAKDGDSEVKGVAQKVVNDADEKAQRQLAAEVAAVVRGVPKRSKDQESVHMQQLPVAAAKPLSVLLAERKVNELDMDAMARWMQAAKVNDHEVQQQQLTAMMGKKELNALARQERKASKAKATVATPKIDEPNVAATAAVTAIKEEGEKAGVADNMISGAATVKNNNSGQDALQPQASAHSGAATGSLAQEVEATGKPATKQHVDSGMVQQAAASEQADSASEAKDDVLRRFVWGVKGGVETSYKKAAADKVLIAPYLQYNLTERVGIIVQPSVKYAGVRTGGTLIQNTYHDVQAGSGAYRLIDSGLVVLAFTGDTLWRRNYEYSEQYDSVVKTYRMGGSYLELEVPVLLSYKVTKKLSVYGGANMVYSKRVGVEEQTDVVRRTATGNVATVGALYGPAPAVNVTSTGTGINYTSAPLTSYTGNPYGDNGGSIFRMGYMLGVSYELKKRWMIDAALQQCVVKPELQNGVNVNSALSAPYVRLTIGYRLSK